MPPFCQGAAPDLVSDFEMPARPNEGAAPQWKSGERGPWLFCATLRQVGG
jgi:hypothetical protein